MIIGRQSEGSIIRGFVNQKRVPYSQRYLFNAIPDTNHNANPTNPNRYSKGNPNPTNLTNPTNPTNQVNQKKSPLRLLLILQQCMGIFVRNFTRLLSDQIYFITKFY